MYLPVPSAISDWQGSGTTLVIARNKRNKTTVMEDKISKHNNRNYVICPIIQLIINRKYLSFFVLTMFPFYSNFFCIRYIYSDCKFIDIIIDLTKEGTL